MNINKSKLAMRRTSAGERAKTTNPIDVKSSELPHVNTRTQAGDEQLAPPVTVVVMFFGILEL
eukprot:588793-Prorocentrum_lima.AAC.1